MFSLLFCRVRSFSANRVSLKLPTLSLKAPKSKSELSADRVRSVFLQYLLSKCFLISGSNGCAFVGRTRPSLALRKPSSTATGIRLCAGVQMTRVNSLVPLSSLQLRSEEPRGLKRPKQDWRRIWAEMLQNPLKRRALIRALRRKSSGNRAWHLWLNSGNVQNCHKNVLNWKKLV